MAKKKLTQGEIEFKAIELVKREKRQWEETTAFVTEKVAFRMRYLIRQLRKNYWGIFDSPTDPSTGRQKTWMPMTMATVENIVKSIDINAKDIAFKAKKPDGYAITDVTRAAVRDFLRKDEFNKKLDQLTRILSTDGTAVWKVIKKFDKKGRPIPVTIPVDLLNIYMDPTEDSIQSAYRFTERSLMLPSEIMNMDGWNNTTNVDAPDEPLAGNGGLSRIDSNYRTITQGTTAQFRDVWELWGKIPKSLITRNHEDDEIEIDGHIVISGIDGVGPICHLVEENTTTDSNGNIIKPYEECVYAKASNRWYGIGPAERIMWLQIYLNTIANIRINRSYVTQLGLHKIKKGSGITPAMLSRLSANGAILVSDMNDIQPLEMPSGDASSYKDEEVIDQWVQKVTGAYDIAVGESTSASSTATANAIQNTNAKTSFSMVKQSIGQFLERWMDRHVLPIIAESLSKGDWIRFSTSEESFKEVIEKIVANLANQKLEEMAQSGYVPTEQTILDEMRNAEEKIKKNPDFFVKLVDKIVAEQLETSVITDNTEIDVNLMLNNLLQMLPVAPEFKVPIIKEAFDLMGLPEPRISPVQQPMGVPGQQPGMPQPQNPEQPTASSLQQMITSANVQPQLQPIS